MRLARSMKEIEVASARIFRNNVSLVDANAADLCIDEISEWIRHAIDEVTIKNNNTIQFANLELLSLLTMPPEQRRYFRSSVAAGSLTNSRGDEAELSQLYGRSSEWCAAWPKRYHMERMAAVYWSIKIATSECILGKLYISQASHITYQATNCYRYCRATQRFLILAQRLVVAIWHGWAMLVGREASHVCHNGYCIAYDHLIAETPTMNASCGLCRKLGNISTAPAADALDIADADANTICPHVLRCFERVQGARMSTEEVWLLATNIFIKICYIDRWFGATFAYCWTRTREGDSRLHRACRQTLRTNCTNDGRFPRSMHSRRAPRHAACSRGSRLAACVFFFA